MSCGPAMVYFCWFIQVCVFFESLSCRNLKLSAINYSWSHERANNIYVICYCYVFQKLQEENERLKAHITTLETTIHKSASDFNERETKWKGEIHQLTCDLQRASQETRELTVQLMALQAKSPEVTCLCSLRPPWFFGR